MNIRELRDEDVGGIVRLLRATSPHQLTSEEGMRHRLASTPSAACERRWVAVEDGGVVAAAGGVLHLYGDGPRQAFVGTTVRTGHRRQGLGGDLFERSLAHVRDAGAVRAIAESGDDEGRRFLERRGFADTHTRHYSRIDPRDADLSALDALRSRTAAEGFAVAPLSACRVEDVYAVDRETTRDVPMDAPVSEMPLDDWLEQIWQHPQLTREGSVGVLHDGRLVTVGLMRVEGDRAMNDMTGTLSAYRGRGLARLAKLSQLEWAREAGIVSVVTENDATNAPMLAVNSRLGYRPFHTVTSYVRELG